jgi:CHAD domain-containing protein
MHSDAVALMEKTTKTRLRTLRSQAKLCRKQFSEEAVHDLRVAMRRLLALVDFLNFFAASPALRKVRRSLKSHLDAFDALRDTQVMLLETSQRLAQLPEVEPFHRYLQKNEKRLLRRAQKDIEDVNSTYAKPIRAALRSIEASSADILSPVDDAYHTVLGRLAMVDAANVATIHRVRIAFKRFRYSFEVVQPLLTDMPEDLPAQMHSYQTLMGEIQDAEVLLRALDDYGNRSRKNGGDLTAVREFYEQLHRQRVELYLQHMDRVHSFWRTAPDAPFAWQQQKGDDITSVEQSVEQTDTMIDDAPTHEDIAAAHDDIAEGEAPPMEADSHEPAEPVAVPTDAPPAETVVPASDDEGTPPTSEEEEACS